MSKTLIFHGILMILLTQSAIAQGNLARIRHGATTKEVQTLMGDPVDRIEREIKREQLWIYPSGSVVFIKGRATSVFLGEANDDILSVQYQEAVAAAKPAVPAAPASPVEDIISEILREVPSEVGEGAPAGPALAPGEVRPVDITR